MESFEVIVNWINANQGFTMSVLTLVYVMATILILHANKKNAQAASEQITEMRRQRNDQIIIAKQQAALQLLERRMKCFNVFKSWVNTAGILNAQPPNGTSADLFYTLIFRNVKDKELLGINDQIDDITNKLSSKNLDATARAEYEQMLARLKEKVFLIKMVYLGDEHAIIKEMDVLFHNTIFAKISRFAEIYIEAPMHSNKLDALKECVNELRANNVEEEIWNELKKDVVFPQNE